MYFRKIRIEARYGSDNNWDEYPFFVTDELRVHVEMDMTFAQQISQASVAIYNLSLENAKALTRSDIEVASRGDASTSTVVQRVLLRVYAGYRDEEALSGQGLPLLLEGVVMNGSFRRALPHNITELYVLPLAARYFRQTFTPVPIREPMSKRDFVEAVLYRAGYSKGSVKFEGPEDFLSDPIDRGRTMDPGKDVYKYMESLSREFAFWFTLRPSGVGIYPLQDDSEAGHTEWNYLQEGGEPYVVSPLLVREAPSVGMATITLPLVFDAKIFPGWVLDVRPLIGNQGDVSLPSAGIAGYSSVGRPLFYDDGVSKYAVMPKYMAFRVVHKIDNYQDQWTTTVIGTVPVKGGKGGKGGMISG